MSELSLVDLRQTLSAWTDREPDWAHLIRHHAEERTYQLLHRDDGVEVYLVCWMPGHDTGFHDHDDSAAAIAVVDGAVTEERLALGGKVTRTLEPGHTVTIARGAIHRVRHAGARPATTLHAYSPAAAARRHLRDRRRRRAAAPSPSAELPLEAAA